MEPCIQAPTIAKIDHKMDRALSALSELAVQKNEISHLIKTQGDHRDWLQGHERRLQALEKKPGDDAVKNLSAGKVAAIVAVVSALVQAAMALAMRSGVTP
jgi:hypothetical protein